MILNIFMMTNVFINDNMYEICMKNPYKNKYINLYNLYLAYTNIFENVVYTSESLFFCSTKKQLKYIFSLVIIMNKKIKIERPIFVVFVIQNQNNYHTIKLI